MKADGEVTVLILTFNDEAFIERAIQSVIDQTYKNLIIKILDNGSTDNTSALIQRFKSDSRVEIITNRINQRSEFAAKIAMEADSPYLSFLFSDDYYDSSRIETMMARFANESTTDAVFSNNRFVDELGQPLSEIPSVAFSGDISKLTSAQHLRHFLHAGNTLHPCAMLIRTSTYRSVGGFPSALHRIGDMTFFAQLLADSHVEFIAEQLQSITILSSDRNESFNNAVGLQAVAIERCVFLESYRQPSMLHLFTELFPELAALPGMTKSKNLRLFWMGNAIFKIPTIDHQIFGAKCMYDAYKIDQNEIDEACLANFNTTFAQYVFALLASKTSRFSVIKFNLRRSIMRLPGGKKLIDLMRPAYKLISNQH